MTAPRKAPVPVSNVPSMADTMRQRRGLTATANADPLPAIRCPGLDWHRCGRTVRPEVATDVGRMPLPLRMALGIVGAFVCDSCRELLVTTRVERVEFYRALGANSSTLAAVRAHVTAVRRAIQGG